MLKVLAFMLGVWIVGAGTAFIRAKVNNDSAIARDTKRIADALERQWLTAEERAFLERGARK